MGKAPFQSCAGIHVSVGPKFESFKNGMAHRTWVGAIAYVALFNSSIILCTRAIICMWREVGKVMSCDAMKAGSPSPSLLLLYITGDVGYEKLLQMTLPCATWNFVNDVFGLRLLYLKSRPSRGIAHLFLVFYCSVFVFNFFGLV